MTEVVTLRSGRSPIVTLSFVAVITCGALFLLLPSVKKQMENAAPGAREEAVAQAVEVAATNTPTPPPTADWMMATANAGNAQAAQLAAQAAQVDLRNAQLSGTIASDKATLEAVIVMTEASDRRTMVAAQATSQMASTATAETERVQIAYVQARNDADVERGRGVVGVLALALAAFSLIVVFSVIILRAWLLFEPVVISAAKEARDIEESALFDAVEIPEFTDVGAGEYIDAVRHGGFDKTPAEWVVKFSRRVARDRAFLTSHYSDVPSGENGRVMYESYRQIYIDGGVAVRQGIGWVPTERGVRMALRLSHPPTVADVMDQESQA